jgi:hypothetical protein
MVASVPAEKVSVPVTVTEQPGLSVVRFNPADVLPLNVRLLKVRGPYKLLRLDAALKITLLNVTGLLKFSCPDVVNVMVDVPASTVKFMSVDALIPVADVIETAEAPRVNFLECKYDEFI